ncbi:J domain-containing protein [Bacillus salipaludis]|uniref:J domain-containing protein n=1 Tax=Bacillus salipaludis TaxID=2547811 RepID=A0A4R5VV06_9BACI|nr:J domain-containing protein [Bacillus salipaludis]TDK63044.1 J domain-containing protein [Bacillus salipaludis]
MLNVKEVTVHLKEEGITDSELTVIQWILEGKITARRAKNIKIDYLVNPSDLASFIIEKKIEEKTKRYGVDFQHWEKTFKENQKLKEDIEQLKSSVRIEQAKVRSLKKMLQAEYALTAAPPLTFNTIFGLDESADPSLLKKEFKKLLKCLHPDRGGDEQLFKIFYEHYNKLR